MNLKKMTYRFIFILQLTFILFFNSSAQILSPDELGHKLINAFQSTSFDTYKKILIDSNDYKETINDFLKRNSIKNAQKKKMFNDAVKKFSDSGEIKYKEQFNSLVQKGEQMGIKWTEIKFQKFQFVEGSPSQLDNSLTGFLNFTYEDSTYNLYLINATKFKSGYKITWVTSLLKGSFENSFLNKQ